MKHALLLAALTPLLCGSLTAAQPRSALSRPAAILSADTFASPPPRRDMPKKDTIKKDTIKRDRIKRDNPTRRK